jgi:hypothetical protein
MTERVPTYFTISRNTVWVAKMDQWLPPEEYPGYTEYTTVQLDGGKRRQRVKARIVLDEESARRVGYPAQMIGVELNVMASLLTGSATARENSN